MTNTESLFPPKSAAHPTIYAYSETRAELAGLLKVGYTDRAVETRMAEHYPTKLPDGTMPYRVELVESAMRLGVDRGLPLAQQGHRDDHQQREGTQEGKGGRCEAMRGWGVTPTCAYRPPRDARVNGRPGCRRAS